MIKDNFVIFRNYSVRGYWELSGYLYTTYLSHEIILSDHGKPEIETMMYLHGLKDIDNITKTLIKYTQDPQEDMFIVEI
jgi:hypothetical protein